MPNRRLHTIRQTLKATGLLACLIIASCGSNPTLAAVALADHVASRLETEDLPSADELASHYACDALGIDRNDLVIDPDINSGSRAVIQQHRRDVFGAVVAKQLAVVAFMKGDLVVVDHGQKIPLGEAAQCRFAEVWIVGEIV